MGHAVLAVEPPVLNSEAQTSSSWRVLSLWVLPQLAIFTGLLPDFPECFARVVGFVLCSFQKCGTTMAPRPLLIMLWDVKE